jgi:hypothetical protein
MENICYFLRALLVIKEPTLKENRSYKYKKIVYLTLEFCRKCVNYALYMYDIKKNKTIQTILTSNRKNRRNRGNLYVHLQD